MQQTKMEILLYIFFVINMYWYKFIWIFNEKKKGLNVNSINNKGNTPLIELYYNKYNISLNRYTSILINKGANINLVNNQEETAFFVSCKIGNYEVASELLKYGANPYLKDNENNSLIYIYILNIYVLMKIIIINWKH